MKLNYHVIREFISRVALNDFEMCLNHMCFLSEYFIISTLWSAPSLSCIARASSNLEQIFGQITAFVLILDD